MVESAQKMGQSWKCIPESSVILKLLPGLYNLSQLKLEGSFCCHERHSG